MTACEETTVSDRSESPGKKSLLDHLKFIWLWIKSNSNGSNRVRGLLFNVTLNAIASFWTQPYLCYQRVCTLLQLHYLSGLFRPLSLKNIPFRLWSCTRDRSHSWQHKFRIDRPWVSCFEITKSGIRTGSCRHFISTECKPTPRPPADYKHWLYGT